MHFETAPFSFLRRPLGIQVINAAQLRPIRIIPGQRQDIRINTPAACAGNHKFFHRAAYGQHTGWANSRAAESASTYRVKSLWVFSAVAGTRLVTSWVNSTFCTASALAV